MCDNNEQLEELKSEVEALRRQVSDLEAQKEKLEQSKKALKESEELYRTVFETSSEAITMNDLEGTIVMVNQGSVDMHGAANKKDLLGKNAFDFIKPDDKERLMKNMKDIIASGGERGIEYTLCDISGNYFPAEVSCSVIKDKQGNPKALLAVGRNISERKEYEKKLQESEELYRTLIDTSADSITVIDLDGRIVMSNPVSAKIYENVSQEELIGKKVVDFVALADRERAKKEMREIVATGNYKSSEYSIARKAGSTLWMEVNVSLIKDFDGNPKALMAIARDISDRKKFEKELAAEKEQLAVTLRSIAEAVITIDIEGKILLINGIAEELTGWKHDEAFGLPLCDVIHLTGKDNDISCNDLIQKVIKTGEVFDVLTDSILVAKDGTRRTVTQSCAPIKDKEEKNIGVVLIIRDITEKQKMESELFKSKKLESIGLLAGGIAHDFNNILTGITSNLFMAKMGLQKKSEPYVSIIEAEKAAFRASKLTNQLLTFAKGGEPIKESQSISEIIQEAVGFSLSGSNVDCNLELPDDLWTLEIDRGQIDQVLNNLIINADQSMPEGGTITVRGDNITIEEFVKEGTNAYLPLSPGRYVRISVRDEGVGVSPENIEKIYDPYFTTKENGTGLGLTISYSILKKHNGLIMAKSREKEGTTFHIYLPASEKKVIDVKKKRALPLEGTGKVLVMDDEEIVRIAAGHVLKVIGYQVVYAYDGQEAIDLYKQAMEKGESFDAIIMDLTIPGGMGGKEAVAHIQEFDPNVKAIVSSGYSTDPVMANYEEYGFCGVVTKPYMVDDLNRVLHEVITGKKED